MKVFIASDLHGSFYYVNRLIDRFLIEKGDLLILLGDIERGIAIPPKSAFENFSHVVFEKEDK